MAKSWTSAKQKEVPVRELLEEYLAFVDDVLDDLDSRAEVGYVREIMKWAPVPTVNFASIATAATT